MKLIVNNLTTKFKTNKIFIVFVLNLRKQELKINKIKNILKYLSYSRSIFENTPLEKNVIKQQKQIKHIITVKLTYSNIMMNLTTNRGHPKVTISSGLNYFTGRLKTSRYAATTITEMFLLKCEEHFKKNDKQLLDTTSKHNGIVAAIHLTGIKKNRKTILRLIKKKFVIKLFKNNSIQSHNGCRDKKKKRK